MTHKEIFQSTPPARGATFPVLEAGETAVFQSTPPARGATCGQRSDHAHVCDFNPRPPRGGRPRGPAQLYTLGAFQSTPPARGGDSKDAQFYLRIFDKQVELLRFLGKYAVAAAPSIPRRESKSAAASTCGSMARRLAAAFSNPQPATRGA